MSDAINISGINIRVCQALGLDPRLTKSVTIKLGTYCEAPTVTVEQFVTNDRGLVLSEIMKSYELVEKTE